MFKIFLFYFILSNIIFANSTLNYVNSLRIETGLNSLRHKTLLDRSSTNHLLYLKDQNIFAHNETNKNNKFFSGTTPTDRIHFLGHNSFGLENMTKGPSNARKSVENLYSAIYHRFSFLNYNIDQIGMAQAKTKNNKENIFIFNMANSYSHNVCKLANFQGFGKFYYGVCIDKTKKISTPNFLEARDKLFKRNPKFIIYPYKYQYNIQPYFLEESPDPLPNCSITGYPISIQFNPLNFSPIKMISFTLYKIENNSLKEITNKKILTSKNDAKFKNSQFALMPLEMLAWGARYMTIFRYYQYGEQKKIQSHFSTSKLPYPFFVVDRDNMVLNLNKNTKNYIYLKPKHCNSRLKKIVTSYDKSTYQVTTKIENQFVNTLSLNINKLRNHKKLIKINSNIYKFKVNIQ